MPKKYIGLDVCPYCKSENVMIDGHRDEIEENESFFEPNDIVCQDYSCFSCKKEWVASYKPVAFYVYKDDRFIDEPVAFTRVDY